MSNSPTLNTLIEALRFLPGVGPKSAQRMAYHLLQHSRDQGLLLSQALENAMQTIAHCQDCNNFCETPRCKICENPRRNQALLCIVESPIDVLAIEQTGSFDGLYFVLMGHLSPLDGIGPEELRLDVLNTQLQEKSFEEVIIATNATVEGEATAHYLTELMKPYPVRISRIAHGMPLGGEFEFTDGGTITRAILSRENVA